MTPRSDYCTQLKEVTPLLYTAQVLQGWGVFCREESLRDGGQWWPKETGATQCKGSNILWIVEPSQVEAIVQSRAVCERFGLECGWSVGSAARVLLKYVGPGQYPYKGMLRLTADAHHNYLDVSPGKYPHLTLFDVKGYYYNLLCRLPSWRCFLTGSNHLRWLGELPGVEGRRREVLEAVAGIKPLRNALVGCMLGKTAGMVYYHAGNRLYHKGSPGIFRAAALTLVRSAWEMTRIASEQTESYYSNVDCVATQDGLFPSVWQDHGLVVEERASGRSEICSPISYRVGLHRTKIYHEGSRFREPLPRAERPDREYYCEWLRAG